MPRTAYTNEEIARIGEAIYQQEIRDKAMPQHKGRFLTLNIETGDYEIDDDDLTAEKKLRARRPNGVFYGRRIGYTTAYAIGGTLEEEDA